MLFLHQNTIRYMFELPLAHVPGTKFNYSTGDSILISYAIRNSFHGDVNKYLKFPWTALFDRIGMKSAVFEQDAARMFLGGTNLYATPRDWARFGLLYLQKGIWNAQRIISPSWIDYTRKSTTYASKDSKFFGAHFWLVDPRKAQNKGIPLDTYLAAGFKGQTIFIIPSRDLVVVRMGWTEEENYMHYDILEAITKVQITYRDKSLPKE
ncbi:MAG: serine hydrolase [Candidatus Riflebacteria bacterium]|nr:serine hydrolase [Candidatus Riflebacteria bacterium]